MKGERFTFVIEKELKDKLSKEATLKGMSASTLIRVLILEYFQKGEL